MKLFFSFLIIWISIGILINIITNKRIPILSRYTDEEMEDLVLDIQLGPIGPIYFVILLIGDRFRDEDD